MREARRDIVEERLERREDESCWASEERAGNSARSLAPPEDRSYRARCAAT